MIRERQNHAGRKCDKGLFELCLHKYPDLPSVALIRSAELKVFPREFLKAPVLDLCCGDGFFTACLGLKGVYGCDIDADAVKQAGRLNGTYREVCRDDARTLSQFADRRFLTVFSNCALEHVNGVAAALGAVSRVLKNDGHLIMTVPSERLNEWFFPALILKSIGLERYGRRLLKEYNQKQKHLNIYPLETWKQKLQDHGLKIVTSFYVFKKSEYATITFFESFALDIFPGALLRRLYRFWKRTTTADQRTAVWRKIMGPLYENVRELKSGGELVVVARKTEKS